MAIQNCTLTPSEMGRAIRVFRTLYFRFAEVHLVLERLEHDAQDRTPWMAVTMNHVLDDFCILLERLEKDCE